MNSNLNPISKNIMDALTAYHERNASINPDPYALLQNKAVLGSYLNDFVKNYSEDPILKMAVSNDIGSIIHEGIGKSAVEQTAIFQRAVKSMTDMGISADKATEIVKYFSDALDWQIQTQPTAPQASAPVMGGGNVTLGASGQNAIPTGNSNFGGEVNRNNYAAPSGGNVTLNSGNRTPIPNNGNVQFSQPNTSTLRSGGANNNNARFTQQNSPMPTSGSANSVIVNDPPKKKKSKGGILFLLLLIILGGGGYMWYTNNMKPIIEVSEASVNVSEPNIATEQTITDEQAETPSVAKETNGKTTELAADKTTQTTKIQKAETKTPAAIPVKTLVRVSADTDSAYYGDTWDNWNTRMQYDADNQLLYYTDSSKKVKIYDLKKDVDNNYLDLESEMNYITFNEFTHTLFLYVYNHYYEYVDGNFNALFSNCHASNGVFIDKDSFVMTNTSGYVNLGSISQNKELQYGKAFNISSTGAQIDIYGCVPLMHNGDYYYFVKAADSNGAYYSLFKTIQLIPSTPSKNCINLKNSSSIASVCPTLNDVYYFTKNKSIYRLNLDNPGEDELLINGVDIENTGTNYVSDQVTQFLYVNDNCFIVYDSLDNCIKVVGELPDPPVSASDENTTEEPAKSTEYSDSAFIDSDGLLEIDLSLIGKNPKEVGQAIGKEITPTEWTYWGNDLTFWEDTNGIGFMFQNNELVIVTYDHGSSFDYDVLEAAKKAYPASASEKTVNDNPYFNIEVSNNCALELFVEYYNDTKDYHFRQRYVSKTMY